MLRMGSDCLMSWKLGDDVWEYVTSIFLGECGLYLTLIAWQPVMTYSALWICYKLLQLIVVKQLRTGHSEEKVMSLHKQFMYIMLGSRPRPLARRWLLPGVTA